MRGGLYPAKHVGGEGSASARRCRRGPLPMWARRCVRLGGVAGLLGCRACTAAQGSRCSVM